MTTKSPTTPAQAEDDVLRRMLSMPPKAHEKPKPAPAKKAAAPKQVKP